MFRIGNFLNKQLANKPAKLNALKYDPVMMVTADVPAPKLSKKSLNSKPNDAKLPKLHA